MNQLLTPELKSFIKVISRLEDNHIPYMLTGSMAMNFYGHPRATNDFDIVIDVDSNDCQKIFQAFEKDYYISLESLQEALKNQSLFNVLDEESVFKIDFIIRKLDRLSHIQFQRKTIKEFMGYKICVISPEDLILAKLEWSKESLSELQMRDIKNLLRILKDQLDYSYMEKWAADLGHLSQLKTIYASI